MSSYSIDPDPSSRYEEVKAILKQNDLLPAKISTYEELHLLPQ